MDGTGGLRRGPHTAISDILAPRRPANRPRIALGDVRAPGAHVHPLRLCAPTVRRDQPRGHRRLHDRQPGPVLDHRPALSAIGGTGLATMDHSCLWIVCYGACLVWSTSPAKRSRNDRRGGAGGFASATGARLSRGVRSHEHPATDAEDLAILELNLGPGRPSGLDAYR